MRMVIYPWMLETAKATVSYAISKKSAEETGS